MVENKDSLEKMYKLFDLVQHLIPESLALRDRQHRAQGVLQQPDRFL